MSRIRPDQFLLPSVYDRLLDDAPESQTEAPHSRAQLLRELKASVRRDLENLLNTRISLYAIPDDLPELKTSVLNYGIPDFTGLSMGSRAQREKLRGLVEDAVRRFETRFIEVRVEMVTSGDGENVRDRAIKFRIDGILYAEPSPEPVSFDSQLRPQLGDFEVRASVG
ncbi:type VI secretion system baseplate subunit TssE [Aureliella helgolandensis]|uniref:Gene 25-like lysozyme n=1 Tax=Aureliella helgolandensis TaxID=2527968 RepID=A0A518GAF4_9BACT|nr:type VI secretion system baseplate subunit TssE [Aureliella helgolandensis]QDV25571.1 Gene 25-like lysozyme [Aureliella helgolandensis]